MKPAPITVVLVDDCSIIKDIVEQTFSVTSDLRLIGYARSGVEALQLFARIQPDVAILDVLMPHMNGFEVARATLALFPNLRTLFFSGMYSQSYIEHARTIGVAGWVVKESLVGLVKALRTIATGGSCWPDPNRPSIAIPILSAPSVDASGKGALTQRELEILQLWTQGFEVKSIAEQLGIASRTVETHRTHIIQKSGTRSLAQLTKLALARGLIPL